MTEVDAGDVLERYISVLKAHNTALIRNEDELPYSKEIIKAVIIGALSRTTDVSTKELLKKAYQSLADFQPLNDHERAAVSEMEQLKRWPTARSFQLTEQADLAAKYGSTHQEVTKRIVAESEALYHEVRVL